MELECTYLYDIFKNITSELIIFNLSNHKFFNIDKCLDTSEITESEESEMFGTETCYYLTNL